MNYNTLFCGLILFIGLGSMPLTAQTLPEKEKQESPKIQEFIKKEALKTDTFQITNRHRDLINAMVKSKIECTIDLFKIENERLSC